MTMKVNALDDTKTPELAKSAEDLGIIVIVCGILSRLGQNQKANFQKAQQLALKKIPQKLHKNKAFGGQDVGDAPNGLAAETALASLQGGPGPPGG